MLLFLVCSCLQGAGVKARVRWGGGSERGVEVSRGMTLSAARCVFRLPACLPACMHACVQYIKAQAHTCMSTGLLGKSGGGSGPAGFWGGGGGWYASGVCGNVSRQWLLF